MLSALRCVVLRSVALRYIERETSASSCHAVVSIECADCVVLCCVVLSCAELCCIELLCCTELC